MHMLPVLFMICLSVCIILCVFRLFVCLLSHIIVKQHNNSHPEDMILTVLCPGLGTAVGRMPFLKCAVQMRTAYDVVIHRNVPAINCPPGLSDCCTAHVNLTRVCSVIISVQYIDLGETQVSIQWNLRLWTLQDRDTI